MIYVRNTFIQGAKREYVGRGLQFLLLFYFCLLIFLIVFQQKELFKFLHFLVDHIHIISDAAPLDISNGSVNILNKYVRFSRPVHT